MFKSKRFYAIAFLLALVAGFAGRTLYYYPGPLRITESPFTGYYRAPEVVESTPPSINSFAGVSDVPAVENGEGRIVLIDQAHGNEFDQSELGAFAGSLASDGARIVFVEDPSEMVARLSEADALIIIAPDDAYDTDELAAINQFVVKGGHLVIVGEPTRQASVDELNTLAGGFGIVYQDAYIYKLTDNETGFRDVVLTNFAEDNPITEGVTEVVFSTAYALRTDEANGVIFGDDDTYSSRNEEPGGVIAAALAGDGSVLALPDFTFFTTPYNSYADNERLLANIAAFALSGARAFDLADFPFFFTEPTNVVYENPVTLNADFEDSVALRERLAEAGTQASLAEEIDEDAPFIYVGLYDDAGSDVMNMLEDEGIEISDDPLSDEAEDSEGTIAIEGVARLEKSGTVLMHLLTPSGSDSQYRLVILAADTDALASGIGRLLQGDLAACQVTPMTAVCRDGASDAPDIEPTDDGDFGGDVGTILIVSDDQATPLSEGDTGAETVSEYFDLLGFSNDVYSITENGTPDLSTLEDYGAVIWLTGDFCCLAPSEEAAALLSEYVAGGGKLFVSGLAVANDWKETEFITETLGAEFLIYSPQIDMEPGEAHPLNDSFDGTITFADPDNPTEPDAIEPVGDAVAVFVRGPESSDPGEASMIAYESGDARVAFAAFPVTLLEENDLALLLYNVGLWFFFD